MLYGITMGDSSGIGPEILLKSFRAGELRHPIVVFGDLEVLQYYNERLEYAVKLRKIVEPAQYEPDSLNVIDHAILRRDEVSPGKLTGKAGPPARDYVARPPPPTPAGPLPAMTPLP